MSSHFLSCDWGTSHFRLRLVDTGSLAVKAEVKTGEGAAPLFQQSTSENRAGLFALTLERHIAALFAESGCTASDCVVSGMVSSSIGWRELPYAVAPLLLTGKNLVKHAVMLRVEGEEVRVTMVSGVRTADDVMRGEECELCGLLELNPTLMSPRIRLILPGTHSKHIDLNQGRLEGFITYMTGELFMHLRGLPTLKGALATEEEISEVDFCEGVRTAGELGIPAGLFKIRARALIEPEMGRCSSSFLSGLLIGAELLSMPAPEHAEVFLAGSSTLHPLYLLAGEQIGRPLHCIAPEILQRSLLHAHRSLLP